MKLGSWAEIYPLISFFNVRLIVHLFVSWFLLQIYILLNFSFKMCLGRVHKILREEVYENCIV